MDEHGPLRCQLERVEVMGRDISILSTHSCAEEKTVRSIINADQLPELAGKEVAFSLKPRKTLIFSMDTEVCLGALGR